MRQYAILRVERFCQRHTDCTMESGWLSTDDTHWGVTIHEAIQLINRDFSNVDESLVGRFAK